MHFAVFLLGVFFGPFAIRGQCPVDCVCEDTDLGAKAKCSDLVEVFPQEKHNAFKILDVSFNNIAILDDRVFHDNRLLELIFLNVSHNIIDKIHMNAFLLMADLKILDLSHNDLSNIGPSAFSPLFQTLEELYLNHNPLLVLATRFAFATLTTLDLSHCHQNTLPEKFLKDMETLVHLNLAANDIEAINRNLAEASQLKNLTTLNLRQNKITTLNRELLLFRQDIQIDLTDNPWECDCDFLNAISLYEQRRFSPALTCVGPEELEGRDASTALAEEWNCTVLSAGTGLIWTSLLAVGIISILALVVAGVAINRKRKRQARIRQEDEINSWGLLYARKT